MIMLLPQAQLTGSSWDASKLNVNYVICSAGCLTVYLYLCKPLGPHKDSTSSLPPQLKAQICDHLCFFCFFLSMLSAKMMSRQMPAVMDVSVGQKIFAGEKPNEVIKHFPYCVEIISPNPHPNSVFV